METNLDSLMLCWHDFVLDVHQKREKFKM